MIYLQVFFYSISILIDNINVRYGNTLFRQIVGNPIRTSCAPLIADLFLYCYEFQLMVNL